jgi:intracellular multiplication protein IcmL
MSDKKLKNDNGLRLVMERNSYYKSGSQALRLSLFALILIDAILLFGVVMKLYQPVKPLYFTATTDGKIMRQYPVSQPVVSDSYVLQWTADKVRLAFSQDYIHWRSQLSNASGAFTPYGWKYFIAQMKSSNNLKTLISNSMVSSAVITGAPEIIRKGMIGGHYAWNVQMPLLVTYENGNKSIPLSMEVNVLVERMPVENYPDRIAINNFMPKVNKKISDVRI